MVASRCPYRFCRAAVIRRSASFGGPVCAGAALGLGNQPGRDYPINLHDYTRVAQAERRLVLRANGRPDSAVVRRDRQRDLLQRGERS